MATPRYLPLVGGTEIHTHETATRIAAEGHAVTVLTTDPGGGLPSEESCEGVHIVRASAWPEGRDYSFSPHLYHVIHSGDWDIVHCQGIHTLVPPLAMAAATRAKIPYVVTFHSGGHSSRVRNAVRGPQWEMLRPLLSRADRLIGVSRFEAEWFGKQLRLPPDRFVIIPNGAQLPDAILMTQTQTDETLIVSVGRLERYKGHQRVIAALPFVLAQRPDVRLRIAGSGPFEPALRRLASELGVAGHVEIRAVSGDDRYGMAELLSSAALVTLLSDYESQGIAAMEALTFKRPVLVTDTSALSELAQRGLARAIPLTSTDEQTATAILRQLTEPLIPPDMQLPSWDACASQLLDLYLSVTGSPTCVS
jgi:glycosyltransferase involved in cell wall biosynthesis